MKSAEQFLSFGQGNIDAMVKSSQIVATGLRHPNGFAIGPKDLMAFADNQGNWLPTSVLHMIAGLVRPDQGQQLAQPRRRCGLRGGAQRFVDGGVTARGRGR